MNQSEANVGDTTFERVSQSGFGVASYHTKPQAFKEKTMVDGLSYSSVTDTNQATMKSADAAKNLG